MLQQFQEGHVYDIYTVVRMHVYIYVIYTYDVCIRIYIYMCVCVCVNFHLVTIEQLQQSERKLGGLNDGSPTIVRLLTLLT